MKKNIIQLIFIYTNLLCTVSCQKNIDKPFEINGEPVTNKSLPDNFSQVQVRPFKGKIVGSFVSTPTSNPTIYTSVANATGNVTHLGAFSKATNDVIDLASSMVEGTFIMTGQGGEQIFGVYNGRFSFGATPGTFSWTLNATIDGGSGKFSNATGEFIFEASGVYVISEGIVHGDYTETLDGSIIY